MITLMCEEAKDLLLGYLDALEECDRIHRMVSASARRDDRQAADGYLAVLSDGRVKLSVARGNYRRHQVFHACSEALNFGDFDSAGCDPSKGRN